MGKEHSIRKGEMGTEDNDGRTVNGKTICIHVMGYAQLERCSMLTMAFEFAYQIAQGNKPLPEIRKKQFIDVNRNSSVKKAIELGADYLLQIDADNGCPYGVSPVDQLSRVVEANPKCVAAFGVYYRVNLNDPDDRTFLATSQRDDRKLVPMTDWPSEGGAGMLLIDVKKIAKLDPPWFSAIRSEDGCEIEMSEDVYFARYLQANGLECRAAFTFPVIHAKTVSYSTEHLFRAVHDVEEG